MGPGSLWPWVLLGHLPLLTGRSVAKGLRQNRTCPQTAPHGPLHQPGWLCVLKGLRVNPELPSIPTRARNVGSLNFTLTQKLQLEHLGSGRPLSRRLLAHRLTGICSAAKAFWKVPVGLTQELERGGQEAPGLAQGGWLTDVIAAADKSHRGHTQLEAVKMAG